MISFARWKLGRVAVVTQPRLRRPPYGLLPSSVALRAPSHFIGPCRPTPPPTTLNHTTLRLSMTIVHHTPSWNGPQAHRTQRKQTPNGTLRTVAQRNGQRAVSLAPLSGVRSERSLVLVGVFSVFCWAVVVPSFTRPRVNSGPPVTHSGHMWSKALLYTLAVENFS